MERTCWVYEARQGITRTDAIREAITELLSEPSQVSAIAPSDYLQTGKPAHGSDTKKLSFFSTVSQAESLEAFAQRGLHPVVVVRAAVRALVDRERRTPTPRQARQTLQSQLPLLLTPDWWRQLDSLALVQESTTSSLIRDVVTAKTAATEVDVFSRTTAPVPQSIFTLQGNDSVIRALRASVAAREGSLFSRTAVRELLESGRNAAGIPSFLRGGENAKKKVYLDSENAAALYRLAERGHKTPSSLVLTAVALKLERDFGAQIDPHTPPAPTGYRAHSARASEPTLLD